MENTTKSEHLPISQERITQIVHSSVTNSPAGWYGLYQYNYRI